MGRDIVVHLFRCIVDGRRTVAFDNLHGRAAANRRIDIGAQVFRELHRHMAYASDAALYQYFLTGFGACAEQTLIGGNRD